MFKRLNKAGKLYVKLVAEVTLQTAEPEGFLFTVAVNDTALSAVPDRQIAAAQRAE